jgi:hypothetical protein
MLTRGFLIFGIHEAELFAVTHEVTANMRAALAKRHAGYGG